METEYYEGGTPIYDKNGVFIGSYTPQNAELKQGRNLSPWEERQAEKRRERLNKQYDDQKALEGALKNGLTYLTLADPATYIAPILNGNGKGYLTNVIEGNGSGNSILDLAITFGVPDFTDFVRGGAKHMVKKGVKETIVETGERALPKIAKRTLPSH